MRKVGNWNVFEMILNTIPAKIQQGEKKLGRVAEGVRSSMVTGITHKKFNLEPNAESTVKKKGSSTPLVSDGDLVGSIISMKTSKGYLVGVHRNATNENGDKIANIFAIHTFGFDGVNKNGKKMKIHKRDAITPALKENEKYLEDTMNEILKHIFTL